MKLRGITSFFDEQFTIRLTPRKTKLGLRLMRQKPTSPGRTACRWTNRLYHRNGYRSDFNEDGVDVFAEDWDDLLILDACRYDMLIDHPFDGECRPATSRGSDTYEFLRANCSHHDLRDTVYVSASPMLYWYHDVIEQNFHDVIYVWEQAGWDEESKTVLPETTTAYALEAAETYPNKRLLVHYLQPHYSFIDSGTAFDKQQLHDPDDVHPSFWRMVETEMVDLSHERIRDLYRENLDRALPYAQDLVEALDGKSVVSADHGNMVGERSHPIPIVEWGHPAGTHIPKLVTVPRIECVHDARREVIAEEPARSTTDADREVVEQHLADLGYLT